MLRFQKAARNRDLLVFSPPYVDFGGAGDIVTISQAVALNGTDSSEAPWVHSVLALDMNVRSLYYLMAEKYSFCDSFLNAGIRFAFASFDTRRPFCLTSDILVHECILMYCAFCCNVDVSCSTSAAWW